MGTEQHGRGDATSSDAAISGRPRNSRDAGANDESDARPASGDGVSSEGGDEQQIAGHVYYFCTQPMGWPDALAHCKGKFSANLSRIADGTQAQLLAERAEREAWIGLSPLHVPKKSSMSK